MRKNCSVVLLALSAGYIITFQHPVIYSTAGSVILTPETWRRTQITFGTKLWFKLRRRRSRQRQLRLELRKILKRKFEKKNYREDVHEFTAFHNFDRIASLAFRW